MALTDGILGCWSPSVMGSGYLLPDISGNANHCALTNMTPEDWTPIAIRGISGVVLDYDGVNDAASCARPSQRLLMAPSTPWTVSAWVNPRSAPPGGVFPCAIGTWHQNTSVRGWLIGHRPDGTLGFGALTEGGSGGLYSRTSAALSARWQHMCVIYFGFADGSNIVGRVYINGVEVNVTAVSTSSFASHSSPQFAIGGDYNGARSNNWQIGEVVVFQGNKAAAEVQELYRRGNGAIGRMLTGQLRRPVYGSGARFKAAWARGSNVLLGFQQP